MQQTDPTIDSEKIISLLARMPLLKMFTREQLGQILRYTTIRTYEFGESIIQEGQTDTSLYIMIAGSCAVLKNGVPIGRFDSGGAIFGEMSLIDGSARSASVVANERTIALCINASFLHSAGDTHQAMLCQSIVFRAIASILAERVRQLNNELIELRKDSGASPAAKASLRPRGA